ncbi:hypothetical protein [Kordiimonas laminariae]|uniref:hypothetical protein n=1 Tax=Kordiimonas laminariae TaxID=2917717 RepID=UPI001FF22170|nr:hypothetical protein [Kordiimonas laminariae]MCK0068139.1 hypothetical protein [Kordiimonas laminariae]
MLLQRAKAHLKNYQFCALILLFMLAPMGAQAQLPPEVELDLAIRELETAIEKGDWQKAQKVLYGRLDNLGIELPPVMDFYKAKTWVEKSNGFPALLALESYFSKVDNSHAKYTAALDLYSTAKAFWLKTRAKFKKDANELKWKLQDVEGKLLREIELRQIYMNVNFPFNTIGGTTWEEMETGNLNRCIRIMNQRYHEANTKLEAKQYPKSEKKACKKGWYHSCSLLKQKEDAVYGYEACTGEFKTGLIDSNRKIKELRNKKAKLEGAMQQTVELLEGEYKEGRF